jgi:Domain of unknown function (DUF1839)
MARKGAERTPIGRMSATIDIAVPVECDWPITNCYIDAWTLILTHWGLDPTAGLGVTVAQDYEGDQFTFFKYQHDDLELLYGAVVGELTIYSSLEEQYQEQVRQGRLVLAEADGYYLPDTRATSYRTQHTKTTIGIDRIDITEGRLSYFHNVGHYELTGEDYAGVFRKLPHQNQVDDVLPPYVEFVKRRWPALADGALTDAAIGLLRRHLHRRPDESPIRRYRDDFPRHMDWLLARPQTFHDYAFGIFRQLGANYQLLAAHADWLQTRGIGDLMNVRDAARLISATAKSMQFKVARIASRGRFDPCEAMFDTLEQNYEAVIGGLERTLA